MKKLVLAFALLLGLAACQDANSANVGRVPGLEPAGAIVGAVVIGCFILGECS